MKIPIRLQIALAASDHGFKKGDRVVSKIGKDDWYTGTVVRSGVKIYIDFDDGYDAVIEEKNFKHVKLMLKPKKLKRSLTDAEAKALYFEEKKAAPVKKPILPIKKPSVLPIKKPVSVKAPVPDTKPAPVKVPPPAAPIHTPAPDKKLQERVYKSDWIILLEGHGKTTWRFTVKDDPTNPTFNYRASSMAMSAQEALTRAINELNGKAKVFTLQYTPSAENKDSGGPHTIKDVSPEDAAKKLGEYLKSLVKAPEVGKPIPTPIKPAIHSPTPAPTLKNPTGAFEVYLVPNEQGKWSYGLKSGPNDRGFMQASDYVYADANRALDYAFDVIPKYIDTFTLVYVETLKGNAIDRKVVFNNMTRPKAREIVSNLVHQANPTFAPAPKPAPFVPKHENEPTANEKYLQVGNYGLFDLAAKGTDRDKIRYMTDVWHRANDLIFGGRLRIPTILRFLKEQQTKSFRRRGHWFASKRELAMSRRIFNASQDKFLVVFVHEMCHQAVSEIDRVVDTEKGHGPYWKAWMVKCGIPPSRYDTTDAGEYMDDDERAIHEAKKAGLKDAEEYKKMLTPVSNRAPIGTPVQFYKADEFKWIQCVVIGIVGTKLLITADKKGQSWNTLPNQGKDRLFKIPLGEATEDYNTYEWRTAADSVRHYVEMQKLRKQARRASNKYGDLDDLLR